MTAILIDGKQLAFKIQDELKFKIKNHVSNLRRPPCLAVILVGEDPASRVYVHHKEKVCSEIGIKSKTYRLPSSISQDDVLKLIKELNHDQAIHGILPQLPMPTHIDKVLIVGAITPTKDVDGLSFHNQGRLSWNLPSLRPCTPSGILEIIKSIDVNVSGKNAVVIGRSILVGLPTATMLTHAGATVTTVHSKTNMPNEICRSADLIVAAAGVKHLVNREWIKKGAIIIDVGIHRTPDGKLTGDVNPEDAMELASHFTPVPGGVGPMTIAMLMKNCLEAYEHRFI
ncbi:MAG: bifunctional methylenetetrahydrofolate dehydrogenase/methenyltetrahydrofolate cyclohydrolase FolD [Proteobacteria bacterium]|nr:bifunctional methylenetetrahydrofolate dehydrogenase/methenyltetrahydrofolate cyclohydrolase FolD [Pseudomonadota bacterium]